MSTRSTIGIRLEDGKVRSIYCHWEGYPSHQKPLLKHYTSKEKVEALIELGALSLLGEEIGVEHPFDAVIDYKRHQDDSAAQIKYMTEVQKKYNKKYGKMCRFYNRDRGDKWEHFEPETHASIDEWKRSRRDGWCKHAYLFNPKTGKWVHYNLTKIW